MKSLYPAQAPGKVRVSELLPNVIKPSYHGDRAWKYFESHANGENAAAESFEGGMYPFDTGASLFDSL
jgi:hypothetical protein